MTRRNNEVGGTPYIEWTTDTDFEYVVTAGDAVRMVSCMGKAWKGVITVMDEDGFCLKIDPRIGGMQVRIHFRDIVDISTL